ncbi:MAG: hypothetical protein KDA89_21925, partial [Planctomycetaceae bacterium]|nr:hypothetical protein [Planctomycetaceae bacterium]
MFPRFDKLTVSEFDRNLELLAGMGIPNPAEALRSLMRICDCWSDSANPRPESGIAAKGSAVPGWFRTLRRILLEAPAPATVIDAVERFVGACRTPGDAFSLFEQTPRSLEVLARLSCGSSYLTQSLLNQPEALRDLTTHRRTAEMKSREEFREDADRSFQQCRSVDEKLTELRRFQRRELLRIGMCDAFGLLDLKFVTLQISLLADAVVQVCLQLACEQAGITDPPFAVMALGKHGGEELNYSSDIDLLLIADQDSSAAQRAARLMIDGLNRNMPGGFLYRVDMRLRPWGDAGPLVTTPDAFEAYLRTHAELWEKQALLKLRFIAGAVAPGRRLLQRLPPLLFAASENEVLTNVRKMKSRIEEQLQRRGKLSAEVKLGCGSIRDVEFLVQALQLIHGKKERRLASANTLDALVRLADFGIIDVTEYRRLREGYVFLRTLEHALQLVHNQQTHELPADPAQRESLARRLDYPGEEVLLARFREHQQSVRSIFERYFTAPADSGQPVHSTTTMPTTYPAGFGLSDSPAPAHSVSERRHPSATDSRSVPTTNDASGLKTGTEPTPVTPQTADGKTMTRLSDCLSQIPEFARLTAEQTICSVNSFPDTRASQGSTAHDDRRLGDSAHADTAHADTAHADT